MKHKALIALDQWYRQDSTRRKPLVLRGARQVGKSKLVREFCARAKLECLQINFEKEPRLASLFVEGDNVHTLKLLESYSGRSN